MDPFEASLLCRVRIGQRTDGWVAETVRVVECQPAVPERPPALLHDYDVCPAVDRAVLDHVVRIVCHPTAPRVEVLLQLGMVLEIGDLPELFLRRDASCTHELLRVQLVRHHLLFLVEFERDSEVGKWHADHLVGVLETELHHLVWAPIWGSRTRVKTPLRSVSVVPRGSANDRRIGFLACLDPGEVWPEKRQVVRDVVSEQFHHRRLPVPLVLHVRRLYSPVFLTYRVQECLCAVIASRLVHLGLVEFRVAAHVADVWTLFLVERGSCRLVQIALSHSRLDPLDDPLPVSRVHDLPRASIYGRRRVVRRDRRRFEIEEHVCVGRYGPGQQLCLLCEPKLELSELLIQAREDRRVLLVDGLPVAKNSLLHLGLVLVFDLLVYLLFWLPDVAVRLLILLARDLPSVRPSAVSLRMEEDRMLFRVFERVKLGHRHLVVELGLEDALRGNADLLDVWRLHYRPQEI